MEPTTKPIIVRYKKLGREKVLGLADLDTQEIIIDPRQPSKELLGTLLHGVVSTYLLTIWRGQIGLKNGC